MTRPDYYHNFQHSDWVAEGIKLLQQAIIQFHNRAQYLKNNISGGPLDNQTWQTEWKTAPLAKVQLCEYENQTLEAFVAASRLSAKFDCPVAHQNHFTFSYCP